ncbi:MAG: hypothetical protein WC254_02315 [Candidatus Woesearchaeota archaeon]|jgi:hypothetical protein
MASKKEEHIEQIKQAYKDFEQSLLKTGQFLSKDTGIGYWGITPLQELHELFKSIDIIKHKHVLDLGSGDGRVVLLAAAMGIKATGIEGDDWLMRCALDMKRKIDHPSMNNASFFTDDFMKMDISQYDLLYVSPDRPFYRGLDIKLHNEMKGKLLVHSYEFLPKILKLEKQFKINGELFGLYHK